MPLKISAVKEFETPPYWNPRKEARVDQKIESFSVLQLYDFIVMFQETAAAGRAECYKMLDETEMIKYTVTFYCNNTVN